ncbi:hypothetical protein PR048_018769 [Dryococelus australis]|uniref:Uncharacterized protein n=1 Tax=Dryococelus australis TaxID=614101 RepID=A0ABQ9HDB7_9NEOP|nr:hypothetical protein PR048_018769 [Dryococelus australis]
MPHSPRRQRYSKKNREALKVAYEDTGANIVCILLERLLDIKRQRCSSMEQYVAKILGVVQEVNDAGCKLEHTLIAIILLRGLTSEFQPLRITLQTSSVQITTDYAKGKLLQQKYTPRGRGDTLDQAFFAQNRGRNNQDVIQKKKQKQLLHLWEAWASHC